MMTTAPPSAAGYQTSSGPLTTLTGLRDFYDLDRSEPQLLTASGYMHLPYTERLQYDSPRAQFSKRFTVPTRAHIALKKLARDLTGFNTDTSFGRLGVLLDGQPHAGKTHLALTYLREKERQYQRMYPEYRRDQRIPTVFINTPPTATVKSVLMQFSKFFLLPSTFRFTKEELLQIAAETMNSSGTQIVVIDEVHNLASTSRAAYDAKEMLKQLSNEVGATFIYAGIDLAHSGLLAGNTGGSIGNRFIELPLRRFTLANEDNRIEWVKTIRSFERGLHLLGDAPGTLEQHYDYLFRRTGGSLGDLAILLRRAARQVMADSDGKQPEKEALTLPLLNSVKLGSGSERRSER